MKKALLVIDMQNDYLWDKRKTKFNYDSSLVKSVNNTISKYKDECDVIYISHLIHNFPTNRLLFGFSIKGTEGAELYSKLNIVSDLKFDKYFGNTYTSSSFKKHMRNEKYDAVLLCGLDQCGCIYHTALGALKEKSSVFVISDAVGCRYSDEKRDRFKNKLLSLGVKYI